MIIRKPNASAPRSPALAAARGLVLTTLVTSLSACGMLSSVVESDKVDYKAATSKKSGSLDVPPDLTQLQKDNRYGVPDNSGIATASTFQQQRAGAGAGTAALPGGEVVGPTNTPNVRVERAGTQRWLTVHQTPEQLWPQIKAFWEESGFTIASETPSTGIMETDWAENRAKIPQDLIRRTIGKVFDSLYSTGERDKYRTRVERAADGSSEIYISQRGVEEVLTGAQKESSVWTPRPNDPGLEAMFLAKLMTRLGADGTQAKAAVAAAVVAPQTLHSKLVTGATDGSYVEADEGFDRAWRRVGLALDRVGFTVEDRDRTKGVYFVRYVDPDAKMPGFFSKLLSLGKSEDEAKEAQRYRVVVKTAAGAATSQVTVQNSEGKPDSSAVAAKILALLDEQLR